MRIQCETHWHTLILILLYEMCSSVSENSRRSADHLTKLRTGICGTCKRPSAAPPGRIIRWFFTPRAVVITSVQRHNDVTAAAAGPPDSRRYRPHVVTFWPWAFSHCRLAHYCYILWHKLFPRCSLFVNNYCHLHRNTPASTDVGDASYGALGHVPPSTFN